MLQKCEFENLGFCLQNDAKSGKVHWNCSTRSSLELLVLRFQCNFVDMLHFAGRNHGFQIFICWKIEYEQGLAAKRNYFKLENQVFCRESLLILVFFKQSIFSTEKTIISKDSLQNTSFWWRFSLENKRKR